MEIKSGSGLKQKDFKGISLTTLGWELAIPIFGGTLLGYQIDRNLLASGNYTFTVLLIFLGVIIGYYNLYKYIELEILRTKLSKEKVKDQIKS